jgi:ABC-type nitrate/sulfonate/bicarbonate transport system ATPase subunit
VNQISETKTLNGVEPLPSAGIRPTDVDDVVAGSGDDLVRLQNVAYAYPDGTEALQDVSLHVGPREIVSIVGPSGCGKSTLLGLLAGFLKPTKGQLVWSPGLVSDEARLKMTLVFQKDTLLPWKTVARNVMSGLKYQAMTRKERRDRASSLLDLVGMREHADRYPYQLSGGMRRRTAFLTGVAPMPAVLALDEPFASLDEPTRIGIHREVHEIVHRVGMSVVLVTHDIAEAVSLSDRIYVMTNRPARIREEFAIPFGPNRDVTVLRENSDFLEYYRRVWHALNEEIRGGSPAPSRL